METLIPKDRWLQDLIHPEELAAWNPDTGPCCTPNMFKLNLRGTPRDDWNISASRVFTDDFMATHTSLYEDNWENRRIVLEKTQAYIKTLICYYRRKSNSQEVTNQTKVAHRRRERKTTVGPSPLLLINPNLFTTAISSSQVHRLDVPADAATENHARGPGS